MSILGIAASGIDAASSRFQESAARIARAGTSLPGSDGDIAADLVGEMVAEQDLKANVTLARTGDEMLGTLINIVV